MFLSYEMWCQSLGKMWKFWGDNVWECWWSPVQESTCFTGVLWVVLLHCSCVFGYACVWQCVPEMAASSVACLCWQLDVKSCTRHAVLAHDWCESEFVQRYYLPCVLTESHSAGSKAGNIWKCMCAKRVCLNRAKQKKIRFFSLSSFILKTIPYVLLSVDPESLVHIFFITNIAQLWLVGVRVKTGRFLNSGYRYVQVHTLFFCCSQATYSQT